MKQLEINCILMDDGRFFLFAFSDGNPKPIHTWAPEFFHWHRGSFYGTKLQTEHRTIRLGKSVMTVEGVLLGALDALELFGTEPFNQFIQWEFDDLSESLLAMAPVVYEYVESKNWGLPDFRDWKEGQLKWHVPDVVWDEFVDEFWETSVKNSAEIINNKELRIGKRLGVEEKDLEVAFDAPKQLLFKDFIRDWLNNGIDEFLKTRPKVAKTWETKKAILLDSLQSGVDIFSFFDEKRFMEWVGIRESELPFTIGLKLEEPSEDGGMWKLSTVLRDLKKEESFVEVKAHSGKVPKKWHPFLADIFAEQIRMTKLIPFLLSEEAEVALDEWKLLGENSSVETQSLPEFLSERGIRSLLKDELFEEDAWDLLVDASEKLLMLDIEILLPSWWESIKNANMRLKARVKSPGSSGPSFVGLDALMDFEWRVSMNHVDLSEEEFRKLIEQNRRLVNIGGQWMRLDPAFIRQMQAIMEKAEKQGMRVQDFIEQQLMYDDLDEEDAVEIDEDHDPRIFSRIQIELHPKLQKFVKNLTDLSDLPDYDVPQTLNGELRPYQKKGMNWLYFLREYGFGACLADDMGLGKTIQLISYLLLVKEREPEAGPALIISPTSVLGNWQRELERFAPSLKVGLHYGTNRAKGEDFAKVVNGGEDVEGYDVVLTTYGLSHLDEEELASVRWGTIVLDEAQNIKNADTKQSRAIRKLKGGHHIALTGTPMENRLTELWSIYDFINKGYLGSLGSFQKRFVIPIEREHNEQKIESLRKLIRPFLLRRTKKDEEVALNLPDKLEQKEYCPLTGEQAAIYEQVVKDTFDKIAQLSGFERKGFVLRLLGHLKQLCNHPSLYLKEVNKDKMESIDPDSWIERSTKLEKLVELFDAVLENEESGLIFTQYIGMGEIIQTVLEKRYGIEVPFMNGSTPKNKRDEIIEDFQNGKFPILILSLKAGGTGLNLTAANHVIHYDRWWNPAVENQATDRAYRIGQTKFVHVHKMISTGTLEEKIDAMLEKKQLLNEEIIQSDQWIADMSDEDLFEILKLD